MARKTKVFYGLIKLKEVEEFKWEEQHVREVLQRQSPLALFVRITYYLI